jgi:uncharacterized membrane protein
MNGFLINSPYHLANGYILYKIMGKVSVHYMGKVSTHIFHMQTISTAFIFER